MYRANCKYGVFRGIGKTKWNGMIEQPETNETIHRMLCVRLRL